MLRRPFRLNQRQAFAYCMRVQHPALFMEMRLGKTLVTMRALKQYGAERILIVAPYSAFNGWEKEILLERQLQFGKQILDGTRSDRIDKLEDGWGRGDKYFILNKEGHQVIPEISDYHWDSVIVDESTCLKGQSSKISKFFRINFRDVLHRFILTGTPAPETEMDYYHQCEFVDPKIFHENSWWRFKKNNFGTINFNTLISPRGSRYIPQQLAQYCLFQTRDEFDLGGEKIYQVRYVKHNMRNRKAYELIEREFLFEIEGQVIDSTVYAITQHSWLKKLCGGFLDEQFVAKEKIIDMKYLFKTELKDQQVIIWCRQTHEILMVARELRSAGYRVGLIYGDVKYTDRDKVKEMFQNEEYDYIACQPECFKYGQDLSCASVMIYYTSPEGAETRLQSEDRSIDVATTNSCLIIDYAYKDTVEEDILESLKMKEGKQSAMRRIVKRIQLKYKEAA